MKVFILTEGGDGIGFGHITRCISICQAFEEKKINPELIINGDRKIEDCLKGRKHRVFNWLKQKNELFNLVANADVLIIDSYLANFSYYKKLSELVKLPVYIDDNKRLDYPGGLILNASIFAERFRYPKNKEITYLLGPRYMPLRKDFWQIPKKQIRRNIKSIMLTFGGSDSNNLTPKILKLLSKEYPEVTNNVVIGMGFKGIEKIKNASGAKTNLIYHPDAALMKKIMLDSDMAISAGGQTLYEFAAIGLPSITIAVADNQLNNINGWQEAGFIKYIGWFYGKEILDKLKFNLNLLKNTRLRKKMIAVGKAFVDGKGSKRLVKAILKIIDKKTQAL